jgi:histone deacetylase 1/2
VFPYAHASSTSHTSTPRIIPDPDPAVPTSITPTPAMHAPTMHATPPPPHVDHLSLPASPAPGSPPASSSPPASPVSPVDQPTLPSAGPPSASPPPPPPVATHRTRNVTGHLPGPQPRLNLTATVSSPLPHKYLTALHDPSWRHAKQEEYDALTSNHTWTLVPPPPGANIVSGKWIFRHKFNSDGSLARHKARWVVHRFCRQPGVDFDETFSPVVKPATIRIVLSLALTHS